MGMLFLVLVNGIVNITTWEIRSTLSGHSRHQLRTYCEERSINDLLERNAVETRVRSRNKVTIPLVNGWYRPENIRGSGTKSSGFCFKGRNYGRTIGSKV